MGANATTSVPSYTSGEVLTAANLSVTNSGIPVFASTVTRDAAFGGTGEKVLAEGQFAYIEATNTTQYYDGAAWQSVGVSPGLVFIKAQTIGSAVSSVTVTDAFNTTYDNYKIFVSNFATSGENNLGITFNNSTGSTYNDVINFNAIAGVATLETSASTTKIKVAIYNSSGKTSFSSEIFSPFLAVTTQIFTTGSSSKYVSQGGGFDSNAASQTGFTLTPAVGTMTGGTIRVYGYANS
jgi:hypothetical protein